MRKRIISAIVIVVLLFTTANSAAAATKGSYYPYSDPSMFSATWYCYTGSLTKTGTTPRGERTIAVDRDYLNSLGYDFGATAIVYYNDYLVGYFIAEDTGGLIKGNKIDIYIDENTDIGTEFYEDLMWYGHVDVKIQWCNAVG